MQTPDAFRSAHGEITTWSPADFDNYEYALEAASPSFQEAAATGRFVIGRTAAGGEVVVELGTAEDLARHIKAGTLQPLISDTSRSGKTSYAALSKVTSSKVKIAREVVAGHRILIADGDWAAVPGSQPLVEGTPGEVREYCRAHPQPARD